MNLVAHAASHTRLLKRRTLRNASVSIERPGSLFSVQVDVFWWSIGEGAHFGCKAWMCADVWWDVFY